MLRRSLMAILPAVALLLAVGVPQVGDAACNSPRAIAATRSFNAIASSFSRLASRLTASAPYQSCAQKEILSNVLEAQYEANLVALQASRAALKLNASSADRACIDTAYNTARNKLTSDLSNAWSALSCSEPLSAN
jgi:hypothetical protein